MQHFWSPYLKSPKGRLLGSLNCSGPQTRPQWARGRGLEGGKWTVPRDVASADEAAETPCGTSPPARPRRRQQRGGRGGERRRGRPRAAGRKAARFPTDRTLPPRAEAARMVARHIDAEEAAGRGEVGTERRGAGHGRGRGTGSGETSSSTDEACARPPSQLSRPDLESRSRDGAGRGIKRYLGRVADQHSAVAAFRHGHG